MYIITMTNSAMGESHLMVTRLPKVDDKMLASVVGCAAELEGNMNDVWLEIWHQ